MQMHRSEVTRAETRKLILYLLCIMGNTMCNNLFLEELVWFWKELLVKNVLHAEDGHSKLFETLRAIPTSGFCENHTTSPKKRLLHLMLPVNLIFLKVMSYQF